MKRILFEKQYEMNNIIKGYDYNGLRIVVNSLCQIFFVFPILLWIQQVIVDVIFITNPIFFNNNMEGIIIVLYSARYLLVVPILIYALTKITKINMNMAKESNMTYELQEKKKFNILTFLRNLVVIVGVSGTLSTAYSVILRILGRYFSNVDGNLLEFFDKLKLYVDDPKAVVVALLFFVIFPALVEELIFRKKIFQNIIPYGKNQYIIISTILYATYFGSLNSLMFTVSLGYIMAVIFLKTRNTIYCIVMSIIVKTMLVFGPSLAIYLGYAVIASYMNYFVMVFGVILFIMNINYYMPIENYDKAIIGKTLLRSSWFMIFIFLSITFAIFSFV